MPDGFDYGCIGRRLTHSYSVPIHNALASYTYSLFPMEPEKLDGFMIKRDFKGINVTIPYKRDVMKYLDVISDDALNIGAVNTVVNRNGRLFGYNTDILGLKRLIRKNGIDFNGKKVLILGSGGTSRTAREAARQLAAREVITVSRSAGAQTVSYEEAYRAHSDAEIIINTTPVGMFPDSVGEAPVDLDAFPRLEGVVDAIYNPLRSALVLAAQKKGIKAGGGLYMLVEQAYEAVRLFTGEDISEEKAEAVYSKIFSEKCNIVLVGMPACGKTTAGRIIADKLSREFFDTDEMIAAEEKMSISDIFAIKGEAYFRDAETRAVKSLAGKTGAVIATGGGCVLREENVQSLKSNGKLFFIDRPLEKLMPTDDRPLASSREAVEKRYSERYGHYLSVADVRTVPSDVPELTADMIIEELTK